MHKGARSRVSQLVDHTFSVLQIHVHVDISILYNKEQHNYILVPIL